MKSKYGLFLALSSLLFTGCMVQEVDYPKNPVLTIASDFLSPNDSAYFEAFEKLHGCSIELVAFCDADSLVRAMNQQGVNTAIDGVLTRGAYSLYQFKKHQLLQPAFFTNQEEFSDESQAMLGIAVDPYIIVNHDSSKQIALTYADLTLETGWQNGLQGKASAANFASLIFQKIGRKKLPKAKGWMKRFTEKQDTTSESQAPLLVMFSQSKDLHQGRKIFPNEEIGGSFYDQPSLGCVRHARHSHLVMELAQYLTAEQNNEVFSKLYHFFPLQNPKHRLYAKFRYPVLYEQSLKTTVKNYRNIDKLKKYWVKLCK